MIWRDITMLVFNNQDYLKAVAARAEMIVNPAVDHCIANVSDKTGALLGGVIFSHFCKEASITIHVGAFEPNWISNDMLWVTFDYPFRRLGVKKLFGQVNENNYKALEFNLKLGFIVEHRIEGVYRDGAMLLMSMTPDTCRWLRLKPRRLKAAEASESDGVEKRRSPGT